MTTESPTIQPNGGCSTSQIRDSRIEMNQLAGDPLHDQGMEMSRVLKPSRRELPGLSGVARVDRDTESLLRRIGHGDSATTIAVIDHIDLDRVTADRMISAGVAAVVNAAPTISGRFPNLGPEALLAAGVMLIDDVGEETLNRLRDGSRIRLHDGAIFAGE